MRRRQQCVPADKAGHSTPDAVYQIDFVIAASPGGRQVCRCGFDREKPARSTARQHFFELTGGRAIVQGYRRRAGRHDSEICGDPCGAVRRQDRDRLAGNDAGGNQPLRKLRCAVGQPAISRGFKPALAIQHDRRLIATVAKSLQQVGQRPESVRCGRSFP
ncbi:hypothetical protein Q8A70_22655 [Rhodospirillaceae bacterium R-7]|uniref:Uncharacterized protein n=1 Tax=Dongia sedimenti TaxID=3064282 RepID=A0ABU0YS04_9PROT|nr:hypothetical protein [Rhodospirillaceae bacterium R-7]